MSYKLIISLFCILITTSYLHFKMRQDEKIINEIITLEIERKNTNIGWQRAIISSNSKKASAYSYPKVREILEEIEKLNENYEALKDYILKIKNENWFLKNITIRENGSYPKKMKFYNLKEELINHMDESLNKNVHENRFKYLRNIKPILENVKEETNGSLKIEIRPFLNIKLDSNIKVLIEDKELKYTPSLPFYYTGDAKHIKCVTRNPYTKESWTYEGK